MKNAFLGLVLLTFLSVTGQCQFITGFGTGDFTMTYSDFTNTATATSYRIQGTDSLNYLTGSINPVLVGNPSQLSLLGTLAVNPNSSFDLILQDSSFNQLVFSTNWSAFTALNTPQTVFLNYSSSVGTFNGTVSSIAIVTNGSGSALDFTFDGLSAVPEPTSMLLLGMGLCGLAMRRSLRRR